MGCKPTCKGLLFEPTCAYSMVSSCMSLSVCLSEKNGHQIIVMTGRAHCQCQVGIVGISFKFKMSW